MNGEYLSSVSQTIKNDDTSYIQVPLPPKPPAPVPPTPTPTPIPIPHTKPGSKPTWTTWAIVGGIVIAILMIVMLKCCRSCFCCCKEKGEEKLKTNSNFDGVSNLFSDKERPMKACL
jgi:hypothetical protein